MYRKLVLGVGLVFSFVGMILTLMVLEFVGDYLGDNWPPTPTIFQNMSFNEFMGLVTFPTAALVVFGFLLLAFGILYPKKPMEPASEDETLEEEKKG